MLPAASASPTPSTPVLLLPSESPRLVSVETGPPNLHAQVLHVPSAPSALVTANHERRSPYEIATTSVPGVLLQGRALEQTAFIEQPTSPCPDDEKSGGSSVQMAPTATTTTTLTLIPSDESVSQRPKAIRGQLMTDAEMKSIRKRWKKADAMLQAMPKRKRLTFSEPTFSEAEVAMIDEINDLRESHDDKSTSLRGVSAEVKQLRIDLGQRLHTSKEGLVSVGRGGKWSQFLRWVHIPKSSADRYVESWKRSQLPKSVKLPSGELLEPSTEIIAALVKKLKPQVLRTLTTPASISTFMANLAAALSPLDTVD